MLITFPDGAQRIFPEGSTPAEVAASISLSRRILLARVDGQLWDYERPLEGDCSLSLLSATDEDGLATIRHDAAHILAQAVQELFPDVQVTIGPVIEDGFYYDFAREEAFSTADFPAIEQKMREIVDADYRIIREVWDREEAIEYFRSRGEYYKAQIIEGLSSDESVSIYRQGDWLDLCRGPHLASTGKLPKAFRLMKLAGAYWRGDSRNEMLQRIYGTAWGSEKDLKSYLLRLEEAEKRDHRRIGQQMGLFHFQPEAQGSVFWHWRGTLLWREVESYMRRRLDASDYKEVRTPQLLDKGFWERSGHWEKFRENMFISPDVQFSSLEEEVSIPLDAGLLAVKPMNCPAHVQIFRSRQRSWRDLPLRLAEFGCCHRNEAHGALHGLMRVRQMTQDDAHIFCTESQVADETGRFCDLLRDIYKDFGFEDISVKLALRPEVRAGGDEVWDRAEAALREALEATDLGWSTLAGEGAFYGPKLEFHLTDAIGRSWQCGTLQLDFVLPERLDAFYTDRQGEKQRPVMLHRAVLGTLERFIGILLEHYGGSLPMWLSPVQVVVATITSDADSYADRAAQCLRGAGLRVQTDLRNEKINYKVREHSLAKVPVIAVVGRREAEEGKLALRRLGGKQQQMTELDQAVRELSVAARPPDQRAES